MLFGVEEDSGSTVKLHLVPDSGNTAAKGRVIGNGVELATVTANERRDNLAERHSGLCGFTIGVDTIPELASCGDLEIYDEATGILVYRRRTPAMLTYVMIFRIENHLLTHWRIDDALEHWYKGIDRQGLETSTQTFKVKSKSMFISGRLLVKNFEVFLTQDIKAVAMFRDPYDELAERLIILKNIGEQAQDLLGPRDAITYAPVIEALGQLERFDESSLKRFFRRAPQHIFATLANPFVRQITAWTMDEPLTSACIYTSLGSLAAFELVGLRSEAADYSHGLCHLLGLDEATLPAMPEYTRVTAVGACLREIRDAEILLERDLELYAHITGAFASLTR